MPQARVGDLVVLYRETPIRKSKARKEDHRSEHRSMDPKLSWSTKDDWESDGPHHLCSSYIRSMDLSEPQSTARELEWLLGTSAIIPD